MADQTKASAEKPASAKPSTKAGRAKAAASEDGVVTIKKYANRRLYNTATSSYVTLDNLCGMVKDGIDFVVYDAKTGEDITRAVLTQIIVEEEAKGQNLLPISFLRQLIGFYGDNLQMVVPQYLESSMSAFAENQERMRSYMQDAFGGMFPFAPFEDMAKRNVAMFDNAMRMFNPMGAGSAEGGQQPTSAQNGSPEAAAMVSALKAQLDQLQDQLDRMSTATKDPKSGD